MIQTDTNKTLFSIGDGEPCGSCVLRIKVYSKYTTAFGRFKGGEMIVVERGEYASIGSAMARKGSTCLARRLLRHASSTGKKSAQPIRDVMLRHFPTFRIARVGLGPPQSKKLRWHVDHLPDKADTNLVSAYLGSCQLHLESKHRRPA